MSTSPVTRDQIAIILREATTWASQTFPASTDHSKLAHLKEEVDELIAEPSSTEELADCLFLLGHILGSQGVATLVYALGTTCGHDILEALGNKLRKNRARVWGKPDKDGVVRHEKSERLNTEECRVSPKCFSLMADVGTEGQVYPRLWACNHCNRRGEYPGIGQWHSPACPLYGLTPSV